MSKKRNGMKNGSFKQSFVVAVKGVAHAMHRERNIKIQMVFAVFIILLSLLLKIPKVQFLLVVFTCFFVICLELVNTGVERIIDKLSPGFDKEYGKVKDVLAGAVLLAALFSVIVGFIILLPPLIDFVKGF